ncbi:MAG: hypothetical protein ACEQSR_03720 [Candidatus Methylacidiphilales bacterium]
MNFRLALMRFILNFAKTDFFPGTLQAVLKARTENKIIQSEDFGTSVNSKKGKLRTLKINYLPPLCNTEGDCSTTVCNPGETVTEQQAIFNLSQCTASKVYEHHVDDVRDIDGLSGNEKIMSTISSLLQGARESLSRDILALIVDRIGTLYSGQLTRTLNIINTTTGAYNPMGVNLVNLDFADAKLMKPYVIGGAPVFLANGFQQTSGVNLMGQNLAAHPLTNWFYDKEVNSAFADGKEHLIAFDPSIFKFESWSKNAGEFATNGANSIQSLIDKFQNGNMGLLRGTILDPVSGLLFDIDGEFATCPDRWKFQIRLNWDLFFMPQNVCNIETVTGIIGYTTCGIVPAECADVVAPILPTKSDFCWTPAATCFPKFIHEFTFNGKLYEPDTNVTSATDIAALLSAATGLGFTETEDGVVKFNGFTAPTGIFQGTPMAFAACP